MVPTNTSDSGRLRQLLYNQYDVIARRQALAVGVTRNALRHKLRIGGPWRKVLAGVYVTQTGTVTSEQRDMAALLYAGPGSVLTGAAAVRRHHLPCPGSGDVDVLVCAQIRVQSAGFVRIQHTTRMPENAWSTRGLRFAPLARAVADAARRMNRFEDVQALVCEAIQRGRCTLADLAGELDAGPKAGSRLLREALAGITAGVRSAAEADLKRAIDHSALEKPMYNPRLYLFDGIAFSFLGIPDAWWQRAGVAAEVDSLQYHFRAGDYEATVARHNRMEAAGVRLIHILPRTIKRDQRRILADIAGAVENGSRNRPLRIVVAVPSDVADPDDFLAAYLASHAAAS